MPYKSIAFILWFFGMSAGSLLVPILGVANYMLIYQMNPDLKKDPNVPHYFQAISDFAPDIAKNPLVAGNVLMQMHRVGPGFVTPQLIRELIGIQGQAGGGKFPTAGAAAAEMSKPTMDLAKFMTAKMGKK